LGGVPAVLKKVPRKKLLPGATTKYNHKGPPTLNSLLRPSLTVSTLRELHTYLALGVVAPEND